MLARIGAQASDLPQEVTDVWPENWPVVELFASLQTQWAEGPRGLIGLRYEVLPAVLDLQGVAPEARRDLFDGLRVMENEVLTVLRQPAEDAGFGAGF